MVGLGQEGLREGGGNCVKYLKSWWNKREERGKKHFKKGGQAGSRGGCLKKGGAGTHLRTMPLDRFSWVWNLLFPQAVTGPIVCPDKILFHLALLFVWHFQKLIIKSILLRSNSFLFNKISTCFIFLLKIFFFFKKEQFLFG